MSSRKSLLLLAVCLLVPTLSTSHHFSSLSTPVAAQSSCTPPLYQGYPSSCSTISLRWLNRNAVAQIDHYDILRGGVKIGTAPANAVSYSDQCGCGFHATYVIRQVMKSGATCQTPTTGMVPHTRPCEMCTGGGQLLNVVSAASLNGPVAPNSVVTLFANPGQQLTSATASAPNAPAPTNLAGTQVLVNGQAASLFYVSPTQINFLMPAVNAGAVNIVCTGSAGERTEGNAVTAPNPGVFTVNNNGSGLAAAVVTTDGQTYQRIYDANRNAVPVRVNNSSQPSYLILFGTGVRNQGEVQVRIAGQLCPVVWSGAHPQWPGLDQINVQLPASLQGAGTAQIILTAGSLVANSAQINIGS